MCKTRGRSKTHSGGDSPDGGSKQVFRREMIKSSCQMKASEKPRRLSLAHSHLREGCFRTWRDGREADLLSTERAALKEGAGRQLREAPGPQDASLELSAPPNCRIRKTGVW